MMSLFSRRSAAEFPSAALKGGRNTHLVRMRCRHNNTQLTPPLAPVRPPYASRTGNGFYLGGLRQLKAVRKLGALTRSGREGTDMLYDRVRTIKHVLTDSRWFTNSRKLHHFIWLIQALNFKLNMCWSSCCSYSLSVLNGPKGLLTPS